MMKWYAIFPGINTMVFYYSKNNFLKILFLKLINIKVWSKNPLIYSPFAFEIMSLGKFKKMRTKLCLYDPWVESNKKNPIRKIEFMIDYIITRS